MFATLETRKPIEELTIYDLVDFPIWEFAIDEEDVEGQDETWVRPVDAKVIARDKYSLSVAADFETSSGAALEGIMSVTTAQLEPLSAGAILSGSRYLCVSSEMGDSDRRHIASELGLPEADVFPLRFTLRVSIEGEDEPQSGVFE